MPRPRLDHRPPSTVCTSGAEGFRDRVEVGALALLDQLVRVTFERDDVGAARIVEVAVP
jgi:hypothetical protein